MSAEPPPPPGTFIQRLRTGLTELRAITSRPRWRVAIVVFLSAVLIGSLVGFGGRRWSATGITLLTTAAFIVGVAVGFLLGIRRRAGIVPPASRSQSESTAVPDAPPATPSPLTEHYAKQLWQSLATTSTLLLAWTVALVALYANVIVGLPEEAAKKVSVGRTVSNAQVAVEEKRAELYRNQGPSTAMPDPTLHRERLREELDDLKQTLRRHEATQAAWREDRKNLKFPGFELAVGRYWTLLIWALGAFGLLFYLLYRRLVMTNVLAKVVQLSITPERPASRLAGIGEWAPFWLAPLPKAESDSKVALSDLRAALGWHDRERRRSLLLYALLAAGGLMHLHVLVVAWRVRSLLGDDALPIVLALAVLLVGEVVLCFQLLRPTVRLGAFPTELITHHRGRRAFLTVVAAPMVAAGLLLLRPRRLLRSAGLGSPRFRSPRKLFAALPTEYRNSFQRNVAGKHAGQRRRGEPLDDPGTGLIHFIDREGYSRHVAQKHMVRGQPGLGKEPSPEFLLRNLHSMEASAVVALLAADAPGAIDPGAGNAYRRLDRRQASSIAVRVALLNLGDGGREEPTSVLWSGIRADAAFKKKARLTRPDYRAFELLARSVGGSSLEVNRIARFIADEWPSDLFLKERLKRWTAPSWSAESKRRTFKLSASEA